MYQMLKRPPYQNWWWRRRSIVGFNGNPADLNPVESYDENGWDTKKWHDNLRVTREWNQGNVDADFTMITKNSLACMESNGSAFLYYIIDADQDDPFSQMSNGDISFYVVFRWDGTVNDTLLWKFGKTPANSKFRMKADGTGKFQVEANDGTNSLNVLSAGVMSSGDWQVVGVTLKNQTNDGELIVYLNQSDPVSDTDASWDVIQFAEALSTSRLYSNDSTTEKFDGALAQISIHQSIHTKAQAQAVNAWLTNKWNI